METAWELEVSKSLVAVHHDIEGELLYSFTNNRRTSITSSREALNGYQKGQCFYCYDDIDIVPGSENLADVDHFFARTLKEFLPQANLDGVWNLVLSCQCCNRGVDGKFAKVPSIELLGRLSQRNEYLISSHHPLRETLILQTGSDAKARHSFLQNCFDTARTYLIQTWQPQQKKDKVF